MPETYYLAPSARRIEEHLVEATREMETNQQLLCRIGRLAAELEASVAESLNHLRRSHVSEHRARTAHCDPVPADAERETFSAFLSRRMAPPLQTCISIEEHQIDLSRKLTRATQSLRAKVDIEMEA